MKHKMKKHILSLLFFLLVSACTPPADTVLVTREVFVSTTVPPSLPTAPAPTLTTSPATLTVEPTPSAAPSATPDLALIQALFLESLKHELNGRQFAAVERKMAESFLFGLPPAVTTFAEASDLAHFLQFRFLPQFSEPEIAFLEVDEADIPEYLAPAVLFPDEATQLRVVGTMGWGLRSSGQGFVYLLPEGDSYRWLGLVVGYNEFPDTLELETIAAPSGLLYKNGGSYWRVDANGVPQLLLESATPVSFNPSGTAALEAVSGQADMTMFDLVNSERETVALDARHLSYASRIKWLDDETAVLRLTDEANISQGTDGFLALFNITDGTLEQLDIRVSVFDQSTISADGTIPIRVTEAGELLSWQNGLFSTTPLASLNASAHSYLGQLSLSPDGERLVGKTSAIEDVGQLAYFLGEVEGENYTILHTYFGVPTDAVLPFDIIWSPNGQLIALWSPSWDVVESGVWVVENSFASSAMKQFLGSVTSSPLWLDDSRLVFTAVWDGKIGLQLYDLTSGQRYWLNTPQVDALVQYGYSIPNETAISPIRFIGE